MSSTRFPRHASSGRSAAALLLLEVIDNHRSLNELLPRDSGDLPPGERRLAGELTYGVLRWCQQLEAVLAVLLKKPLRRRDRDLHMLLLTGIYQTLHLSVPGHVAVSQTVEATRDLGKEWAAGLVNGVLRTLQRDRSAIVERATRDPVSRYAHPPWLLDRLREAWPEAWRELADADNARAPMSLRVNRLRQSREAYLQQLTERGIAAQPLRYSQVGIQLRKPVAVDELPHFGSGAVSVQDGAAQLAAEMMALEPGFTVLDACAAPGGKSCHLLETEPALSRLMAVDIDARRLAALEENLSRLGLDADVRVGDAAQPQRWWSGGQVDRILLDAPCSGTGVIRRHPDIKHLRRDEDIAALAGRQQSLLAGVWPLLKPGGMLIYATCSVLPQENELQIRGFLERFADAEEFPISAEWGVARSSGRQILTGEEGMDGFYYARLIKRKGLR